MRTVAIDHCRPPAVDRGPHASGAAGARIDNPRLPADAFAGGALRPMRAVRLVIAALVGLALAMLPMSAGFAKQAAGKAEMGAGMSMSAPDDVGPGCDTTHDHAAAVCSLKCCGTAAILVEAQPLTAQRRLPSGDMVAAAFVPFTLPPDPP